MTERLFISAIPDHEQETIPMKKFTTPQEALQNGTRIRHNEGMMEVEPPVIVYAAARFVTMLKTTTGEFPPLFSLFERKNGQIISTIFGVTRVNDEEIELKRESYPERLEPGHDYKNYAATYCEVFDDKIREQKQIIDRLKRNPKKRVRFQFV